MTNNAAARVELEIPAGTRVILLGDCKGSIEDDFGDRVQTVWKNEIVTIYKSRQDKPKVKPRTSSNLGPDEYVQNPREYSVKAFRGTWIPYAATTSADPKGVNNDQLIPHGSLGPDFKEPTLDAKGFYAKGNRMVVTKPVMCKNSRAPGGKLTIGIGARVVLRSNSKTQKTGKEPRTESEAFYQFQVLLPGQPMNKEFRSGGWLLPDKDFKVLDN